MSEAILVVDDIKVLSDKSVVDSMNGLFGRRSRKEGIFLNSCTVISAPLFSESTFNHIEARVNLFSNSLFRSFSSVPRLVISINVDENFS